MNSTARLRLNPWREVSILMLIIMEVSWITPWFKVLTPQIYTVHPWLVWIILMVNVLFSHLLIRIMEYLQLKTSIRRVIVVILLLIACLVGLKTLIYPHQSVPFFEFLNRPLKNFADIRNLLPVEFIVTLTMLLSVWRGISLAQEGLGPTSILSHFWIGIFMYIIFVILITVVTGETPGDFFFLFLFASLIGVSTARMSVISHLRGGREIRFSPSWFGGILLISCFVAALASFVGGLLGSQFDWIRYIVLVMFGSIIVLLWVILSPIFIFLINIISSILKNSIGLSGIGDIFQKLNSLLDGLNQNIARIMNDSGANSIITSLAPFVKAGLLIGILILVGVVIIFWLAIRIWEGRESGLAEEERPSGLKAESIRSLLEKIRNRLKHPINNLTDLMDFRRRQKKRAAARIRQIYADVLELCKDCGKQRPQVMTPLEFEPEIVSLFPDFRTEISTITHAYLRVRYGLLPETQNEVSEVENSWRRIHSAGIVLIHQQKQQK